MPLRNNMRICYFGIYDQKYSRNRILINGLRKNGVEITECHSNQQGIGKYVDLIKKHRQVKDKYDLMIVGFPGPQAMILARFLSRKKIVFDAFASLYDSVYGENNKSIFSNARAFYFFFLDKSACLFADKILLDTNSHIDYYVQRFKIKKEKFIRIFVGSDDSIIYPQKEEDNGKEEFLVHFHGLYTPLQGVEHIIGAAEILKDENIKFNIIGGKIKDKWGDKGMKNINFFSWIPYENLGAYMQKADVCLGIFGGTDKAMRVIPNKLYEALAMRRAVITGISDTIQELLTDKENVLLCKMASAEDLAGKILELKNNAELRTKIAENGYRVFKERLFPKAIAKDLIKYL